MRTEPVELLAAVEHPLHDEEAKQFTALFQGVRSNLSRIVDR